MKLQYDVLRDKIIGCWLGKNAGGALGAIYEGTRGINDASYYERDYEGNPPPNDDLDLQLVWLNAAERYGRNLDAKTLGEYWLSFIIPDWVEYGSGKTNLMAGLLPPVSGKLENGYSESCGSFIRSEIWACLCPGHPNEAAKFAYEDAIVDHSGEAVYAEVFCAAVESAAFSEVDTQKLIDIGLSYIPEECEIKEVVELVRECRKKGLDVKEARARVMTDFPGTFGMQFTPLAQLPDEGFPQGVAGKDVVNNIGLMMIGWLYGESFGECISIAVNCGEDTDCTAATLGAILGIIQGAEKLPEKWIKPLGTVINTFCVNTISGLPFPKDIDELTDRTLRMIPQFLNNAYDKEKAWCVYNKDSAGFTLEVLEGDRLYCENEPPYPIGILGAGKSKGLTARELCELGDYAVKHTFELLTVIVDYGANCYVRQGEERKFRLRIFENGVGVHRQYFANIKLYAGGDVVFNGGGYYSVPLQNLYKYEINKEFSFTAEKFTSDRCDIIAEISLSGRHTSYAFKISFLCE